MKLFSQLENKIAHTAGVLNVRRWESAAFYEVDLHIPGASFGQENTIQHIKCRVGKLTYRHYTIAKWDKETHTCTLFIDAAHNGKGSAWVNSLKRGDELRYLAIQSHYCRQTTDKCLFLGDGSSIGHFLAIQQALGSKVDIEGTIVLPNVSQCEELNAYYPELYVSALQAKDDTVSVLCKRLNQLTTEKATAYLAGNTVMVTTLRRQLKINGYHNTQIKAQGLWR